MSVKASEDLKWITIDGVLYRRACHDCGKAGGTEVLQFCITHLWFYCIECFDKDNHFEHVKPIPELGKFP